MEATAEDLLENTSTFHTDVDRDLFDKIPLESASSSVSSLVTLATPGVAADSNGLFHGLGDHAENSFSVDGQPITDQQSKVFSNQIPLDSIQSMEVISGAPPAEYGDKTSLVIDVTTRSGQGMTTPHGSVTTEYGSFGTSNVGFNLGYGGKNWGNFIAANGLNTGRFLDPPEFTVMHDKGNEENLFDRVDYQISTQGLDPRQSAIHALLVPDAQFVRSAELDRLVRRGGGQWRPRPQRLAGRPRRPALADQDLQYCAIVDPLAQRHHSVYLGSLRAAGPVQLLSQRQSVCRPFSRSAVRDGRARIEP